MKAILVIFVVFTAVNIGDVSCQRSRTSPPNKPAPPPDRCARICPLYITQLCAINLDKFQLITQGNPCSLGEQNCRCGGCIAILSPNQACPAWLIRFFNLFRPQPQPQSRPYPRPIRPRPQYQLDYSYEEYE